MKHFYAIFLLLSLPLFSIAQTDYYVIDSTLHAVSLISWDEITNAKTCQVKRGKEIISYSPEEITEYGFKNGQIYVSKDIVIEDTSKRVFLERLYDGKTTLYYYRGKDIKTFYIQKDSSLFVEMPKLSAADEKFTKQLLNITADCPNVKKVSKLVSYRKRPLKKLFAQYNRCEMKAFPHFKYGLTVGYELSKLVPSEKTQGEIADLTIFNDNELDYFAYKYDGNYTIGLFLDNLILASDFSVHLEVLFAKHSYTYSYNSSTNKLALTIKTSRLSAPLLLRYTLPKNNLRPYFSTGLLYSYNIKNENALYSETISFFENKKVEMIKG